MKPDSAQRVSITTARVVMVLAISMSSIGFYSPVAHATEIIPSIGITKSLDNSQGHVKGFGGLALRAPLSPFFDVELGVSYRQEVIVPDQLKLVMWPVTASLWVRPIPVLYAGVGVGYYPVTFDYANDLNIKNFTDDQFGIHVGAGADIPLAPKLALDLHGRYVMLRETDTQLIPGKFNPDYWNASVGLAFKF